MSPYEKDTNLRKYAPNAIATLRKWRTDWEKPLTPHELVHAQELSRVIDKLFTTVSAELRESRNRLNNQITLWPQVDFIGSTSTDYAHKELLLSKIRGNSEETGSNAFRRLKTVLDAWCSLWMWPLDKIHLLPDKQQYLHDLSRLLLCNSINGADSRERSISFLQILYESQKKPPMSWSDQLGFHEIDADAIIDESEWIQVAQAVAAQQRFVHFDLIFADVLTDRGGFDLVMGNPPWKQPTWNVSNALSELDPLYCGLSSTEANKKLQEWFCCAIPSLHINQLLETRALFLNNLAVSRGEIEMATSPTMNYFIGRKVANLYLCFIDVSFRLLSTNGFAGLVHQDGHLTDNRGTHFRSHWYRRIRKHFHFLNKLQSKNFADIGSSTTFSLNMYCGNCNSNQVKFDNFTDAYLPTQITDSYDHDGLGEIPRLKDSEHNFDTRGHLHRIVQITTSDLEQIAKLTNTGTHDSLRSVFVAPFDRRMLETISVYSKHGTLLSEIPRTNGERYNTPLTDAIVTTAKLNEPQVNGWNVHGLWCEVADQRKGNVRRDTNFHPLTDTVLQGPHIYVGNPLFQTPRRVCIEKSDYDIIDTSQMPLCYSPRSNFIPTPDSTSIAKSIPRCIWNSNNYFTDHFRVGFRRRINLTGERSLVAALIPPRVTHVNTIHSIACTDLRTTLAIHALLISLPIDNLVKMTKKTDFRGSDITKLPFPSISQTAVHRGLRLASLTAPYAKIWEQYAPSLSCAPWSSTDNRLGIDGPVAGTEHWGRKTALRTDFARRLALVEVDVLVAQSLELTLKQLLEMYRIYFPVLQQNEANTYFDQQGRIVWTRPGSLANVGYLEPDKAGTPKRPSPSRWREILESKPPELTCIAYDDTLPDPNYQYANADNIRKIERRFVGPFTQCDRVDDYKRAWAHFDRLRADGVEV